MKNPYRLKHLIYIPLILILMIYSVTFAQLTLLFEKHGYEPGHEDFGKRSSVLVIRMETVLMMWLFPVLLQLKSLGFKSITAAIPWIPSLNLSSMI